MLPAGRQGRNLSMVRFYFAGSIKAWRNTRGPPPMTLGIGSVHGLVTSCEANRKNFCVQKSDITRIVFWGVLTPCVIVWLGFSWVACLDKRTDIFV